MKLVTLDRIPLCYKKGKAFLLFSVSPLTKTRLSLSYSELFVFASLTSLNGLCVLVSRISWNPMSGFL